MSWEASGRRPALGCSAMRRYRRKAAFLPMTEVLRPHDDEMTPVIAKLYGDAFPPENPPQMSFDSFHFNPQIMAGLKPLGYDVPTPIQRQAIPKILEGRDVLGLAQTGTG